MRLAILGLIFCLCNPATSQLNGQYNFKHLTSSDGLLYPNVKDIQQDKNGFIWILTQEGLQRYDGTRFINYTSLIQSSSPQDLPNANLVMDTASNNVCVVKKDQIERFHQLSNSWTSVKLSDLEDGTFEGPEFRYSGENGAHYQICDQAVKIYLDKTEMLFDALLNINGGEYSRHTYCLKDSVTGKYWFHNYNHVLIADPESKKVMSSGDAHPEHPLFRQLKAMRGDTNQIRFLMMDHSQNLWISTWNQSLFRFNFKEEKLYVYALRDLKKRKIGAIQEDLTFLVNALYEDRQHQVWIATDHAGLLAYNREKDDFNFITSDPGTINGIEYNFSIHTLFQDRDDNIWLGTDRGISIFNPYRNPFQAIRHIENQPLSLPRNDITDIIETPQGEIMIATWGGGISFYDLDWKFKRNILFDGLPDQNLVWSFVQHDDGSIWAGAQHGFIHIYDPVRRVFKTLRPPELGFSTIRVMARDQDGNILLGLNNGKIATWDKLQNKFLAYQDQPSNINVRYRAVMNLFVDDQNRCWVSTGTSLKEFNIEQRSCSGEYIPENINPLYGVTFKGIEDYNDSTLILTSVYFGVFFFDKNLHHFSQPVSEKLLSKQSTHAIKKDKSGNFWISTNDSVLRFNFNFSQSTRFHLGQSIIRDALNHRRFYVMHDDRWITSSSAELICFQPEKMNQPLRRDIKVEICGFQVFDKRLHVDSLLKLEQPVILPYNRNFFTVEFSTLDFTPVTQQNYYYRLSDIEQDWNHTTTKQFADYTDLKPGTYVFEVKVEQGEITSAVTAFSIVILPPWWGTLWFRVFILMAAGSLLYYVWKRRVFVIRKAAELKHRMAETEMMALRSQMNPHFIFNCINGIDGMIHRNDKYQATRYLNKFAKLIRNVLESSKQNLVPLSKDLETLQLYIDLELFRHPDMFIVSIEVDPDLIQHDFKVPPLIIQPYVENAILHGLSQREDQRGKLQLQVRKSDAYIVFTIEDNGVGRPKEQINSNGDEKGYGMQMSQDRIRLFNEEQVASVQLTDLESDGLPAGTRVQVKLKMQ